MLRALVASWGSLDPAQGRHPQTCRDPFMSDAPTHAFRVQQVSFKGNRIHAFVSAGEGRDAGRYAMAGRCEVWVPGEVEAAWPRERSCWPAESCGHGAAAVQSECERSAEAMSIAVLVHAWTAHVDSGRVGARHGFKLPPGHP
jgi:hypothetical protein